MDTATAKRISIYLLIGIIGIAAELSALMGMVL